MKLKTQVENILTTGDAIASTEDYVRWVRDWKKVHANMVTLINFLRQDIKDSGVSIRTNEAYLHITKSEPPTDDDIGYFIQVMSNQQHHLSVLKPIARDMYDARVTHKDLLKKGQYPKLNLHMDGHNSKQATLAVG